MSKEAACALFEAYAGRVERLLLTRKDIPYHEHEALKDKAAHIRRALERWNPAEAQHAHMRKAAEARAAEQFTFTWRGAAHEELITGWHKAAERAGYAITSLRVMLSRGKGKTWVHLVNPVTDESDVVCITRHAYKAGVGRPKREREAL